MKPDMIVNFFQEIIPIALCLLLIICFVRRFFIKEVSLPAVIVKKDSFVVQHYNPPGSSKRYVITFNCENRELRFYTSYWFFDASHIGERGMLTYRGETFISFEQTETGSTGNGR